MPTFPASDPIFPIKRGVLIHSERGELGNVLSFSSRKGGGTDRKCQKKIPK